MGKILSLIVLVTLCFVSTKIQAHPSRIRLLMHGKLQLTDSLSISGHLVIPNLLGELAPVAFLEFDWKPTNWLIIAPTIAHAFEPDEVIASLRLAPSYKKIFWGWLTFEMRPQSRAYYWFVQAEWKATEWLAIGIEEESWGNFETFEESSHGGGANMLVNFGKRFRTDFAIHLRDVNSDIGPEFFLRFHVFL